MPNYDYQCISCGYTFEEFQKMTDESLKECPECKGQLKRLIGAGLSPIFKGSGFYQTDYKKSTEKKENKKSETSGKNNNAANKELSKTKKPE